MELKGYVAAIVRLWWLVALIAISATAGSYLYTKAQPAVYHSSILLVSSARLEWGTTMSVQVHLRQQEERLKTLALAGKVNERLQLNLPPAEIQGKIRTMTNADSISIRLDVEDSDPERARLIALGYGQAFGEEKAEEYARMDPENRVMVTMLEEPSSGTQIRPNTRTNTAAGAAMGLLLGVVLVLLLEYLDDTLRTPEDVARHLGLATLGSIPSANRARHRWAR